jgi:hypothetical protein
MDFYTMLERIRRDGRLDGERVREVAIGTEGSYEVRLRVIWASRKRRPTIYVFEKKHGELMDVREEDEDAGRSL